ncbi:indole-3-glycerol phosphate synthase TrpC [Capnocytophaga cynodegmi]|uniref:indole-3-glycerol phosphate synthase TrpC n=1 Tax=Capnocytophaga cynodegmi TaxID=28189 RepID=UPI001AC9BDF7|nr:indole-3-glycerol phosphate synthase TrpC [Capnocytophaga cynodegmi]GIM54336.1 indole-3-glycerol phosphate synthase [Capnocytophaga cynodegmi]
MNILDKIIQHKKEEVSISKKRISIQELKNSEFYERESFSLKQSIQQRTGIIAEFKRKSPSKGIINNTSSVQNVCLAYEKFGASGISILTDKNFFGGNSEDILQVRKSIKLPILRKDFMIDEYQFYEAKAMGADVVLLIASCLSVSQTQEFTHIAKELNLEVLIEIHNENELKHINQNIDIVGINNRNLKDFKVDLQHSVILKNSLPKDKLSVAESGIYSEEDFKFLRNKGFDAFLMGEYFMRNQSPEKAFENFVKNTK